MREKAVGKERLCDLVTVTTGTVTSMLFFFKNMAILTTAYFGGL